MLSVFVKRYNLAPKINKRTIYVSEGNTEVCKLLDFNDLKG